MEHPFLRKVINFRYNTCSIQYQGVFLNDSSCRPHPPKLFWLSCFDPWMVVNQKMGYDLDQPKTVQGESKTSAPSPQGSPALCVAKGRGPTLLLSRGVQHALLLVLQNCCKTWQMLWPNVCKCVAIFCGKQGGANNTPEQQPTCVGNSVAKL